MESQNFTKGYEPFKTDKNPSNYDPIKPSHHRGKTGIQVWDVVEEFELNFNIGSSISYLLRAGKKPDQPYLQELDKAIKFIEREKLEYSRRNPKI
jgi:hypothetical protein